MPSASHILDGLALIANESRGGAILWHGALLALLFGLALGFRPREHHARVALTMPLASVSIFAWTYLEAFNGTVFGLWAALLAIIGAARPSPRRVSAHSPAMTGVGLALIAFGWVYPHFLRDARWWHYLYEAPLGLIPCPTLAVVIGLTLWGGGLGSYPWSLAVAALGVLYGAFGALHLGVTMDWVLLIGSALLVVQALRLRRDRAHD